ncbi:MAG: S8 family peptidase, partial [Saprospiraceae bacterium]|nr:S8 family peptidase [Saprospiraceae bacterium]
TRYLGTMEDTVDHNYHWHDAIHAISPLHMDSIVAPENNPCGLDVREPCDDNGHGTHTMGTMVGRSGMDTIGVAPGARWIACRNMERGYGSPASYIECFEWFLAPTDLDGNKPDPARAPHVINNSWSCPPMEGCHPGNFELIRAAIGNLRAAGIVVVTSAGNAGPDCNTINRPPGMFAESFVVGATNINDTIADFSSRGAVQVDSSGRIKPDVVAPGVGVRSAWLDSNYIFANGTSMAGPHVAGTVALIISANPDLAGQVGVIEDIIRSTAIPLVTTQVCDSLSDQDVPNNTYGYGRINALAAVRKALTLSSVRQPPAVEQLQVFPNPARDDISVRTTSGKPCSGLSLVSITGQVIRVIPKSACADFVSIAELPPGMYFLTGEHAGRAFSARFVKM